MNTSRFPGDATASTGEMLGHSWPRVSPTESGTDKRIIIENQLTETDHDHLGKLITYASGKNANIVIWLVKHARDEHKAAVEWLNNHTDNEVGFFLCEIKLYKIGDSNPAVKFEIIEKPNDWSKEVKSPKGTKTEQLRYEYWQQYKEYISNDISFNKMFKVAKPSRDHWLAHYVGKSAFHMNINMLNKRNELVAEIYISDNKDFYKKLLAHKEEIEASADINLEWKELENRKASRIIKTKHIDSFENHENWNDQFEWIKETIKKIYTAVKPFK